MAMSTACKLCYEQFSLKILERVPRICQCKHTFCTECIQKIHSLQGFAIECPYCLTITTIPSKGVDYLPKNYAVIGIEEGSKVYDQCGHCRKLTYPPKLATLHCMDCHDVFCGPCSDKIHLKIDNQGHIIRLANSFDDMKSMQAMSCKSSIPVTPNDQKQIVPRNSINHATACEKNDLSGMVYCQQVDIPCCTGCKNVSAHMSHQCSFIQSDGETKRDTLIDLQLKLDQYVESCSQIRGGVQNSIDKLKSSLMVTKDDVSRCFRQFHAVLDETEENIVDELQRSYDFKMSHLSERYSLLTELFGRGKNISLHVEQALDLQNFEIRAQRKKLEDEIHQCIANIKGLKPVENAALLVQFPYQETLLNLIRVSAFLVRAPPSPNNFKCSLTAQGDVSLSWGVKNERFTYPATLFGIYSSVGKDSSFVMIQKISAKSFTVNKELKSLEGLKLVQFQVTAFNIIGESKPCFPICIRLVKPRLDQN